MNVGRSHYTKWLAFCLKHMSKTGEIAFDENGLSWPKEFAYRNLPFDQSAAWTYFKIARDEGHVDRFAENGRRYFRFCLADKGKVFVIENYSSWWTRQMNRLLDNTLTIITAVILALVSAWVVSLLGPKP